EALHLALAVDRHLHHAAARAAGDVHLVELGLHLGHARLQLLGLLHHLAEILHPSPFAFQNRLSSPSDSSSAISSACVSDAALSACALRTASISAPGKASSTARTSGCCSSSARKERARSSACSRKVAAPPEPAMLTTQRRP